MLPTRKAIVFATIFAIAMAYVESAIVIYLRTLFYPEGFDFPIITIEDNIILIEIIREMATIVMLVSIALIMGRTLLEKFAYFLYCFAIWDIFYYAFLKLLIGWPETFMTWDVLFLIPIAWTSPVICPIISSLIMILFAGMVIHFYNRGKKVVLKLQEWLLLIIGSLLVFISFIWDYYSFISEHIEVLKILSPSFRKILFNLSMEYVPETFNWWMYGVGKLLILISLVLLYRRIYSTKKAALQ